MADFQPVERRKKANNGIKREYQEKANDMATFGFALPACGRALEAVGGDVNAAGLIMLGEIAQSMGAKSRGNEDEQKLHFAVQSNYKVHKCRDKSTHDIGKCMYWHTDKDRRRNPFDILYSSTECPVELADDAERCHEGDACMKCHNKLEKMFHTEVYKLVMCQMGPKCTRGVFCAFAHSQEDSRKAVVSRRMSEKSAIGSNGHGSTPTLTPPPMRKTEVEVAVPPPPSENLLARRRGPAAAASGSLEVNTTPAIIPAASLAPAPAPARAPIAAAVAASQSSLKTGKFGPSIADPSPVVLHSSSNMGFPTLSTPATTASSVTPAMGGATAVVSGVNPASSDGAPAPPLPPGLGALSR